MDFLITKEDYETKASDLKLEVLDFYVASPAYESGYTVIKNRNGRLKQGGRFSYREITASGYFYVDDYQSYLDVQRQMFAEFMDENGYFITQIFHVSDMYEFELPGLTQGEVDLISSQHKLANYGYHVIAKDVETNFRGKSGAGLLYSWKVVFETDNMPYGETKPKNISVSGSIPYKGTATNSQLESPWVVKLTATSSQSGDFFFDVGGRRFEHNSKTSINAGDVFHLKGVETWLNYQNVNDYTNYEHFELKPTKVGSVPISTNFVGRIEIENLKELYK